MKKVILSLVVFGILLFIGSDSKAECYDQGGGCITCISFDAEHHPWGGCVNGNGCRVETTTCGHPID